MKKNGDHTAEEMRMENKALIIAVSEYDEGSGLDPLSFCRNDGRLLYNALKDQYHIPDTAKLIGHVSGERMKKTILDFFLKDSDGKQLFFYFSGHAIPGSHGNHFLAPSDISQRIPLENGFKFKDLSEYIHTSNAGKIVTVLDCCYSGVIAGTDRTIEDAAKMGKAAMSNTFEDVNSRCILASSLDIHQSYNMPGRIELSRFTYFLIEGLHNALDTDGNVTPEKLSNYIYERIGPLAEQKPVTRIRLCGDMEILRYPERAQRKSADLNAAWIKMVRDGKLREFNDSREQNGYRLPDFRGVDFSTKMIKKANLAGADFSKARLRDTIFSYSDLSGVNFSDADLTNSALVRVLLAGAVFSPKTKLEGANFTQAVLAQIDFSNINLSNTSFEAALFEQNTLFKTDLSGAKCAGSIIIAPKFADLLCTGADFYYAILDDKKLASYLKEHGALNVPKPAKDKNELESKLKEIGMVQDHIDHLLSVTNLP